MALSPSQVDQPSGIRTAAVAIYDSNGVQLSGFDSSRPATAALTSVPSAVTSSVILPANAARRQVIVVNESSKTLYLAFAATATITAYTVSVAGGATFVSPINSYTGVISGIWAAANGNARVTEITT